MFGKLMDIWESQAGFFVRELVTACLRFALALYIVMCVPFIIPMLLFGTPVFVFPEYIWALIYAAPLAPFHRMILRKDKPYFRRGYSLVVIYGPTFLFMISIFAPMDFGIGLVLVGSVIYEVAAAVVAMVYLWLWKLGDKHFAREPGRPRVRARIGLSLALLLVLAVFVPHTYRVLAVDRCLDAGGRVLDDGACEGAVVGGP